MMRFKSSSEDVCVTVKFFFFFSPKAEIFKSASVYTRVKNIPGKSQFPRAGESPHEINMLLMSLRALASHPTHSVLGLRQ